MRNSGESYLSTAEIGISELIAGVWLRKRIISGCHTVPLINGKRLNSEQLPAAHRLLAEPVSALTGIPGSGKTFVLKTVFDSFVKSGKNVSVISFTGSAASRLGEVLETTGSTVHRFLGYNGTCFEYSANNQHPADVVIIDEAGQLGAVLHMNLLSALRDDCVVIYTGDPNQLPSIEPGNVLAELIECVPHAQLTQIMRTDPDGPIGLAAQALLKGDVPANAESGGNGFYSHPCSDENLCRLGVIATKRMAELHSMRFDQIRTMAPTNRWVKEYNKYCLDNLEPGHIIPIIARRNNYDYGYFNGDTGHLEVNKVLFDNGATAPYIKNELIHALGWSSTVFVAQGKEFECAQLLMPRKGGGRPNFAEVYTAVTRGKKRFLVLGCLKSFAAAIKAKNKNVRTSLLSAFVKGTATVQKGIDQ